MKRQRELKQINNKIVSFTVIWEFTDLNLIHHEIL